MTQVSISRQALFTRYSIIGVIALLLGGGGTFWWLGILTDFETVQEANSLVENYINNATLRKVTKNAFGGTLPKDSVFMAKEKKVGVRMWFCYNENRADSRYPEFFIVPERLPFYGYHPALNDNEPYYPTLIASDAFDYPHPSINPGYGYDYISKTPQTIGNMESITRGDVRKFSDAFQAKLAQFSLIDYMNYKYAFFFFDNENHFGKLLAQSGADYVRFFFSFDDKMKKNKMRLLLIAAKADGTTIATAKPTTTSPPIMLQKSVPPPPDN